MPVITFFSSPWLQDIIALFITFGAALLWLRVTDMLAQHRIVSRQISRKLIHIGTGPIFVLCWLLYSGSDQARWLAALVPAIITLQFTLIWLGVLKDEGAVQAMSRSGNRRELLYGPLQYGVVFVLATLLFWVNSPVGIITLMILCGGDGLADVVGRRFGKARLPVNANKSWAGSIAMLVAGFALAFAYVWLFSRLGVFHFDPAGAVIPIFLICLAATVVEAVSGADMDNVTISVTALGVAWLLTDGLNVWDVGFLG